MNQFVGSCADDSIGIGTILVGSDVRSEGCVELLVEFNDGPKWIEVYDYCLLGVDTEGKVVVNNTY